jgi:transposase
VSEDGLVQFGESHDHRPDLPQLKVMLSVLDPLGLPRAPQIVAGASADDPLSIPAIEQGSQSLQEQGLLSVGDCKMAALHTRAFLHAQGDSYLCPLANKQVPDQVRDAYLQPVWTGERSLIAVPRTNTAGQSELIAEGFEQTVTLTSETEAQPITWNERHLIVRSIKLAEAAKASLQGRLTQAQAALEQLSEHKQGKRHYRDPDSLCQAAHAILKHHGVEGLLRLQIEEQVEERALRAYGNRPASVRVERTVRLHTEVDEVAVAAAMRPLGWRVYATNHPQEGLALE